MAWANVTVQTGRPTRLQLTSKSTDPAIAAALERMAGRSPEASEYGSGWVQSTCELPACSRSGLVLRQELPLEPLLDALAAAGQPSLILLVQHPRTGFVSLAGASVLASRRGTLNATVPTGAPHQPLVLELGWRGVDVARVAGLLLLAFLAPIAAGLAVWRRSIARDRVPEAWFGRAQAIHLISMAGWVLWMVAVEATRVADFAEFGFPGLGWSRRTTGPLCLLGFLPAALVLVAIVKWITRRLRGFDPLPRGAGGLGSVRMLGSLLLIVVAIVAFSEGNLPAGVFALLAAIAAGVLLPGAPGPLGARQALSSGALRDRLFDLARRAGVKLRGLYVVPMRRERMANAFAVSGGVVLVAGELLDHMSRREVDAVLAHEISHLEHRHPIKALLAGVGVWASVAAVAAPLAIPYGFPGAFVASWLTYLFVVRRFEFAADAGAAALTSDAEGVISGLGRLARLNDAPLTWGRGRRGLTLTLRPKPAVWRSVAAPDSPQSGWRSCWRAAFLPPSNTAMGSGPGRRCACSRPRGRPRSWAGWDSPSCPPPWSLPPRGWRSRERSTSNRRMPASSSPAPHLRWARS